MNIFSMDSAFYRFISRLGDLMVLNVLFLIGCAGIITIGPSLTAMYTVLLKLIRNESGYIAREYWRAFRDNFRQAAAGGLKIIFLFFGMIYVSVLSYLFAVQSRFENTIRTVDL